MAKYVTKRILTAVITLMVIVLILFILLSFIPGSPFRTHMMTQDMIDVLYSNYGLDRPIIERYFIYLRNVLSGDFGVSYNIQVNMPISAMLATRFPVTVRVGLQGLVIGILLGILLGILAALNHNTAIDTGLSAFATLGASVPSFVFALALMYFLGFKLKLLPLLYTTKKPIASTILPSIALAMLPTSNIARFTRSEMLTALSSDYILLAEAKGISRPAVVMKHALRNILIAIMTLIAPTLIELITGSMVVENIFSIPGIGSLLVQAIQSNDYNVTISIMFIYSLIYIAVMLFVDLMYGIIDPKIRLAGDKK